MKSIIIFSVFIIIGLISIAQYFAFSKECEDERIRFSYMVLSFSLAISSWLQILLVVIYGYKADFIVYGIDRILKTLVIYEIVYITKKVLDSKQRMVAALGTTLSYGAALLYVLDVFVGVKGLVKTWGGVYYIPTSAIHIICHLLYYIIYTVILIVVLVNKRNSSIRRSEKYALDTQFIVLGLSSLGFLSELIFTTFAHVYFPIALLFNLASVILMRKSLIYFISLDISEEVFEKELDPGRLDIVFILDDEMKVMYQNKRAEVLAQLFKDEFIGRKLPEIFKFDDNAYGQINAEPSSVPFGLTADYEKNGHHINMIVQHKVDSFNEILATSVIVYNLEDSEVDDKKDVKLGASEEKQQIEKAIEITQGAKLLVVDDDIVFLNVFVRMLKQFKVDVIRARSSGEFRKAIRNNIFDMIFITNELEDMLGSNMAKEVRELTGDYYKQVPIVIMTENDINEVFIEFISTGFNDFLSKPVATSALSLVLTRWLWKRFTTDSNANGSSMDAFNKEMGELRRTAKLMYESKRFEMLGYCVNAVKQLSRVKSITDMVNLCNEMLEALMLEDRQRIDSLYIRIDSELDKALTLG